MATQFDIYETRQADFGSGMKLYHFYGMSNMSMINARLVMPDGLIDSVSNPDFSIPMQDFRKLDRQPSNGTHFTKGT